MNVGQARFNMIEQQIRPWNVSDGKVLKVIEEIPRELFVPEHYQKLAFSDLEIPLQHGQFMMAPKIEARVLQALQIKSSDEILEVGTGSGFLTACLASLGGHVDTFEYYQDLSRHAQSILEQLEIKNISCTVCDTLNKLYRGKQYDIVVITASMPSYLDIFEPLLADNGKLFVVVGKAPIMQVQLVSKVGDLGANRISLFETNLAALLGIKEQQTFQL